jgi:hypothetical protein
VSCQRAPFNVHDVVQVVVVPRSHWVQAPMHCSKTIRLYEEYSFAMHELVEPVTSPSGEQEAINKPMGSKAAKRCINPSQIGGPGGSH